MMGILSNNFHSIFSHFETNKNWHVHPSGECFCDEFIWFLLSTKVNVYLTTNQIATSRRLTNILLPHPPSFNNWIYMYMPLCPALSVWSVQQATRVTVWTLTTAALVWFPVSAHETVCGNQVGERWVVSGYSSFSPQQHHRYNVRIDLGQWQKSLVNSYNLYFNRRKTKF